MGDFPDDFYDICSWKNIVAVSMTDYGGDVFGVRSDGTVAMMGDHRGLS